MKNVNQIFQGLYFQEVLDVSIFSHSCSSKVYDDFFFLEFFFFYFALLWTMDIVSCLYITQNSFTRRNSYKK